MVMDLSNVNFDNLSFDSSPYIDTPCGSNGLPITPNSIRIIGNFKARVEHINCSYLTRYVDCFRNKDERVTIVFESLSSGVPESDVLNFPKNAKQLFQALDHLHNKLSIYHGIITPQCLVWSKTGDLKLTHWPINLLTEEGYSLSSTTIFPPTLSYIAPEQVKDKSKKPTKSCDIWSAGLTLLKFIKPSIKIPDNPCRVAFCDNAHKVLDFIDGNLDESVIKNSHMWMEFFLKALEVDPDKRGSIDELLSILERFDNPSNPFKTYEEKVESNDCPLIDLSEDNGFDDDTKDKSSSDNNSNPLILDIHEIYHLWRLSMGRNFESEQRQDDYPPIFKVPYFIVSENQSPSEIEPKLSNHYIFNYNSAKRISLDRFKADIERLDKKVFHPKVSPDFDEYFNDHQSTPSTISEHSYRIGSYNNNNNISNNNISTPLSTCTPRSVSGNQFCNNIIYNDHDEQDQSEIMSTRKALETFTFADLNTISDLKSNIRNQIEESSKTLPIVIKEANFAYQCERISLFKKLLSDGEKFNEQLYREASIDIPPYYRAEVWANLLHVDKEKSRNLYKMIDKTAPMATERQISVDIPRCHQYNELMASPQGHQKLAQILKAWLNYNADDYVYWQGLDSLASPFLLLNFQDEAMAFACFNAFVDKYLRGMFRQVNQDNVQQYLAMFSKLLDYHDSSMSEHLKSLGFLPNLYAIPWFLTMFTHVLPLHKILHVWDCLMLGDEKFPLCIGLAILNQLKKDLMGFNFNDCLGVFSDLPEIDIERCISDANHFYCTTPDKLINLFDIPYEDN